MGSSLEEELYWSDSRCTVFNFEEGDDGNSIDKLFETGAGPKGDEEVFVSNVEAAANLPIHALISKRNLDAILDEIKPPAELNIPPAEETVKKMFFNQKYVLSIYKTLKNKMELLDAAVATFDGNVITEVTIYLSKTLKKQVFLQQLLKRKAALRHYINYLVMNNRVDDLADLYMFSGCSCFNLKDLFYFVGKDATNKERLYARLEQFRAEHVTKFNSEKEKADLVEYLKFLKWQIDNKQSADSVMEQLAVLYKNELTRHSKPITNETITQFKKTFRISDFQDEWVQMNVLASLKLWKGLSESFIIKHNWLMQRNALKSAIRQELFVTTLNKHEAPKSLLEEFLACMSDDEKSLELAKKLRCHKFVIDAYISQRDRVALVTYKSEVPPQSTDLLYLIDHALRTTDKKWKN